MTEAQPVILTAADIHAIEARAHEMRAQALADAFRTLGRGISLAVHKLAAFLHRPRTA